MMGGFVSDGSVSCLDYMSLDLGSREGLGKATKGATERRSQHGQPRP